MGRGSAGEKSAKVQPSGGRLDKSDSGKRRNRKAWPGDEGADDGHKGRSPKHGDRKDRRDRPKKKKDTPKAADPNAPLSPKGGKAFKPTANQRGARGGGAAAKSAAADAVKASLAAVGGPGDKYKNAAEESYEERKARLKAQKKKRDKGWRTKMWHKFWQALGMEEAVALTSVEAQQAVKALNLRQKDLKYLKKKFEEVDVDGSGTIDSVEFFDMLDEERTPLTDQLFALMDLDGNGTIEFDEFVAVLLTYCMYSKDDILRFCFDTFDKDHSNSIDENEFMALLSTVNNGQPMFPGNMATALMDFDSNDDGLIDFGEFKVIEQRFPLIFFPAFRLQEQMQKCTLGTWHWRNIHILVQKQRFKNEHRRTHGRDPPVPVLEILLKILCCRRSQEIDIDIIDSKKPSITSAREAADKKKAIMEGGGRKKRPSRATRGSMDDEDG